MFSYQRFSEPCCSGTEKLIALAAKSTVTRAVISATEKRSPATKETSPNRVSRCGGSELGAAVDAQRVTGDPAGLVGGEKYDSGAYIIRLGNTFQRLDSQRELATSIGPREVRHLGLYHTWRDGIDADA